MGDGDAVRDWWRRATFDMAPGRIAFPGTPVEAPIGAVSLPETIWLTLREDRPTRGKAALLEAAPVAGVDHGPQALSIAAVGMAATCGAGL